MHNLLTVKETAKYLRIPLPTVYYLVQRGQLPAIQIGGRWRIKKASLDKDILKEDKAGQPTVLVVDDDESLQNLFKIFLKKIGFSRIVVGTVKDAIAALEKQKFDLLFLDLKLPDGPADDVYDVAKEADPKSAPFVERRGDRAQREDLPRAGDGDPRSRPHRSPFQWRVALEAQLRGGSPPVRGRSRLRACWSATTSPSATPREHRFRFTSFSTR